MRRASAPALRPLVTLLAVALAGCAGPRPASRSFLLDAGAPPARGTVPGAIYVRFVETAAPYDSTRFVYRLGDDRWETDFYNGFLLTPSEIFTAVLRRWATSAFESVAGPAGGGNARYLLASRVNALYADFRDPVRPVAILSVDADLFDRNGTTRRRIGHAALDATVPLAGRSPDALVNAWNAGLRATLPRFFRTLAHSTP